MQGGHEARAAGAHDEGLGLKGLDDLGRVDDGGLAQPVAGAFAVGYGLVGAGQGGGGEGGRGGDGACGGGSRDQVAAGDYLLHAVLL